VRRVLVLLLAGGALVAALAVAGGCGGDEPYRVRAIFDNAAFVVRGEDVKISGVKVGKIDSLHVTPDNKAAVVLDITEPGFQDFRRDATCTIRPQSLIGEQYVECTPTQPRASTEKPPPPLQRISSGAGEGQRLLPVERTSASVALDLLANINRLPVRQRLTLIINELGTGLAGRGEDLNVVIRRAAPALTELNRVLDILARQNRTLEQLAVNSDQALAPLARERKHVTGFITAAARTAAATAERRADLQQDLRKLPGFLA
jgi:ABC-type transporter Mla subunit MlaD